MDKEMKACPCPASSAPAEPQAGPHVVPQETEAPPPSSSSAPAQAPPEMKAPPPSSSSAPAQAPPPSGKSIPNKPAPVRTKRKREEDTLEEPPPKRIAVDDAPLPRSQPSPQPSTSAPQMSMEETEALPHSSSSAPAVPQVGPHMAVPTEDSEDEDEEQGTSSRVLEENRFSLDNSFLPDRYPSPRAPSPEGEDEVIYLDDVMNLPLWPEPYRRQPDLYAFLSCSPWSPYMREM